MKQNRKNIAYLGICIFILFLIIYYWGSIGGTIIKIFRVSKPLFYGCALAYIVNILMSFYENKLLHKWKALKRPGLKRMVSMVLAYASIIIIMTLVIILILSEFFACIQTLLMRLPEALAQVDINQWIQDYLPELPLDIDIQKTLLDAIQGLTDHVNEFFSEVVNWASSIMSVFSHMFIAFMFSIYLLAGKERVTRQVKRLGRMICKKENVICKIKYVLKTFNHSFHKFIVGQSVEACILGTLCVIGMLILRLPYAGMIGTLIGFTALIPILGAYLGAAVGAIMILTVDPIKAVIFLIFIVILQQVEGNLIYPKVVGTSIGLPGIWVFAAITIGGGVLGIPGMLLGVPTAAAVYKMLKEYNQKSKEQP